MDAELITNLNSMIVLLFCALSAYQYIYILVSVLFSSRRFTTAKEHRYAVLICARNEENVIAQLIDSIKKQDYPSELVDIYLLADNCTDQTAAVAEAAGAIVYERHDLTKIGKGYAMHTLLTRLRQDKGEEYYDGYFVFDADNLLAPDYIRQMNTVFSNGYRIVTSYRNSKNFCHNWVTAGYGVMFLREARHMNNARMILHSSCAVSGTGFLVHRDIINENDGWPYYTLTEDLEFTMDRIAKGDRIGYCHDAIFYDEQPTKFRQSWSQRIRWTKGFIQAFFKRGGAVLRGMFTKRCGFSCFDEIVSTMPNILLAFFGAISAVTMVYSLIFVDGYDFSHFLQSFIMYLGSIYAVNFFLGLLTIITEWKKINGSTGRKIRYAFTFPLFMMTGVPINIVAVFVKVKWKHIEHSDATTIDQISTTGTKNKA
ncbi:MAG: glycosyltransferase family 2 protein [Clostridia bacterium]|nr:glycosyltransferase family 2 protein [Clostridia bacterium]